MHEYHITAAALWLARSAETADPATLAPYELEDARQGFRRLVELTFSAPCCYMSSPAAIA